MKKILFVLIAVFALILYFAPLWNLRLPDGEYPELILPEGVEKRALVVVAHDDDACAMTGLVYKLIRAGWKVDFLTFYHDEHMGYRKQEISLRKKELKRYAESIGLHAIHTHTFQMRKGNMDTIQTPYMPIPVEEMHHHFETDSLRKLIEERIDMFRPSVLLSLDDQFGGYGHPEHLLVSKTMSDICLQRQGAQEFSVRYFYQVVLSELQERRIAHLPVFQEALKIYHADGTPEPSAALYVGDITEQMKIGLTVWESQARNMRKFFPYFQFYPHYIYFRVIDKEYYRVIAY